MPRPRWGSPLDCEVPAQPRGQRHARGRRSRCSRAGRACGRRWRMPASKLPSACPGSSPICARPSARRPASNTRLSLRRPAPVRRCSTAPGVTFPESGYRCPSSAPARSRSRGPMRVLAVAANLIVLALAATLCRIAAARARSVRSRRQHFRCLLEQRRHLHGRPRHRQDDGRSSPATPRIPSRSGPGTGARSRSCARWARNGQLMIDASDGSAMRPITQALPDLGPMPITTRGRFDRLLARCAGRVHVGNTNDKSL